ncbi:hypothetical protein PAXINDRAFT_20511 [Paxillus involutus ATCC 200175]|uniref:CUE domain-containing protein n=1 Tax=Paxillus involutus ATCC 200175 TaxID=664439 RepID=A0A0C9SMJ6_PAXIN|nr:hypothetical protein PAXINDRAFT_20511 [Paxillus involutus ATCC 200175]
MFPDFEDAVILSVLGSTDNDQERALDVFLGMNDLSYVPPVPPPSQPQHEYQHGQPPNSQRLSQEDSMNHSHDNVPLRMRSALEVAPPLEPLCPSALKRDAESVFFRLRPKHGAVQ